jgi:uncharacterized protein (TIGR02001 family)
MGDKPMVKAERIRKETIRPGLNAPGSWFFIIAISILVLLNSTQVRAQEDKPLPSAEAAPVAEDKPTATLSTDFLSQYLFRGVAFSAESAVIQPSLTLAYKGLSLNVWGNFDTNEKLFSQHEKWNETDITLSYSREIYKNLTGTIGYIYYSLPNSTEDSNEFFLGLSYAFPWFTVGVTGYREFNFYPGWWMQIDLSRNFKLPWYDMNIDVGASFGYLDSSTQHFADWHSGTLTAALNIPINKYITISPRIGFAFPLTADAWDNVRANSWDGQPDHVFGGLRVTASF